MASNQQDSGVEKKGAQTTAESINKIEYEVPVSESTLLDLGRVTAILSQIDFLLTEVLSAVSKTPPWATYIFAERATMSAKIGMLDSMLGGVSDPESKKIGKKIVKALHRVNEERNVLFHGMWAHHINPKTERGNPACIWQNKKPIRPADLPDIAQRAALLSRQLGDFLGRMHPSYKDVQWTAPRRIFIATENIDLSNFAGGNFTKLGM